MGGHSETSRLPRPESRDPSLRLPASSLSRGRTSCSRWVVSLSKRPGDVDGEFVGYEELEGFSDSLQARFSGARFTLTAATSIGNAIRASWTFGPPERPDAVTGMDFVTLDGDKISQLYAFVERPDD